MYNHSVLSCDSTTFVKSGVVALAFIGLAIGIACNLSQRQGSASGAHPKTPAILHLPAPKTRQTPIKQQIVPKPHPAAPTQIEPFRPETQKTHRFAGLFAVNAAKA